MVNKLNKNDRGLLIFLAEYRLLAVSQIAALCAVCKPAARNRVGKLTSPQLVKERTPVFGKGRGRLERWVSLTNEGVDFLKAAGGLPGSVASQEVRADAIRRMDHLLELNWFRIHLLHLERICPQLTLTFLSSESPFLQRSGRTRTVREHLHDNSDGSRVPTITSPLLVLLLVLAAWDVVVRIAEVSPYILPRRAIGALQSGRAGVSWFPAPEIRA